MNAAMPFHPDHPETWPGCRPMIIAHDVARSRDYSTAVAGGICPYAGPRIGIIEAQELPQNLVGLARASALATIDRHYTSNAVIVADLSQDPSYADALFETFGDRVIGLQITRNGDGMTAEHRPVMRGSMRVYAIGRSYLFDQLHSGLQADQVRLSRGTDVRRAYDQLTQLELEHRESGVVYTCPSGRHDDLAISMAMVVWAARHPHLEVWCRRLIRKAHKPRPKISWEAWT
jgi:hypothetical protein